MLHVSAPNPNGYPTDVYLDLTDGISGDYIYIQMDQGYEDGVAFVQLSDGTTLSADQLFQIANSGGSMETNVARLDTSHVSDAHTGGELAAQPSTPVLTPASADTLPMVSSSVPAFSDIVAPANQPPTVAAAAPVSSVSTTTAGAGTIIQGSGAAAPTVSAAGHVVGASASPTTRHGTAAALATWPNSDTLHPTSPLAASGAPPRDVAFALSPHAVSTALDLQDSGPSLKAEPDEGAKLETGAPTDPITHDPNDAGAWMAPDNEAGGAEAGGIASHGAGELDWDAAASRPQVRRLLLGRTADAANDMIKALTAQGSLRLSGLEPANNASASQIQLQGGATWSLSTLDKAMSAAATAGRGVRGAATPTVFGSADLAHGQLISAMAAFGPVMSANTSLPPTASDADAITLAIQLH